MKQEDVGDLVSIATFTSIFSSFCARGNIKEAVAAFDNMGRYGLKPRGLQCSIHLSASERTGSDAAQQSGGGGIVRAQITFPCFKSLR
jgi:pentatricopeptide repeat protein